MATPITIPTAAALTIIPMPNNTTVFQCNTRLNQLHTVFQYGPQESWRQKHKWHKILCFIYIVWQNKCGRTQCVSWWHYLVWPMTPPPPPPWLCPVCRVHIRVNITTRTATGYKLGGLMFSVLWLLKWQLSPLVRVWCHVLTGLIDWKRLAAVRRAGDWALVRLSPVHKDIIKEKRAPMMMMIGHMVPAVTGCGDNR